MNKELERDVSALAVSVSSLTLILSLVRKVYIRDDQGVVVVL